jgi:hypothetical protein
MKIRLGLPTSYRYFSAVAVELGAGVLVSANRYWRPRERRFSHPRADVFNGAEVDFDSAGFVAQFLYGGYRWTVPQYVELVAAVARVSRLGWWAQMDFCCEPQIAGDAAEVRRRQILTLDYLARCRAEAARVGLRLPLPVLQGWRPDDYRWHAARLEDWPPMVGLGSVCRRPVGGPDGVVAIVNALDRDLPRGVKLHLFGAKSGALGALAGHPRVGGADSCAWDQRARYSKGADGFTLEHRAAAMRRWYLLQRAQLGLFQ